MSNTLTGIRGRRVRYDNIAIASVAGAERLIAGDTVSPNEIYGGGTMTSTSAGEAWHSNVAVGSSVTDQAPSSIVPEQIIQVGVANYGGENVKVGG